MILIQYGQKLTNHSTTSYIHSLSLLQRDQIIKRYMGIVCELEFLTIEQMSAVLHTLFLDTFKSGLMESLLSKVVSFTNYLII